MSIDLAAWAEHLGAVDRSNDAGFARAMLRQQRHVLAELQLQLVAVEGWLPEDEETRGAALAVEASAALRSIRRLLAGLTELEDAFRSYVSTSGDSDE